MSRCLIGLARQPMMQCTPERAHQLMMSWRKKARVASEIRRADQTMYEAKREGRSRATAAVGNAERAAFSQSQSPQPR